MEKTILVTGKDTFLGNELVRRFLDDGCRVASTVTGRKEAFPKVEDARLFLFPWNRRSSISAKNFLLETLNHFGPLDEAYLIFSPEKETQGFPEIPSMEMEEKFDNCLKGFLFLARELFAYQIQRPRTNLHFILFDDEEDPSALEALEFQGVRAFLQQMALGIKKRGWPLTVWEGRTAQTDLFAQYLLDHVQDPPKDKKSSVTWTSYGEKKTNLWESLFRKGS